MESNAPLTREEFQQLDDLMEMQGGMRLPKLHGYLTAVISGPSLMHPNDWVPWIWGGREDAIRHPEFTASMDGIRRLYNNIRADLESSKTFYPLLTYEKASVSHSSSQRLALIEWCQGYMEGVELTADTWFMADHREAQMLLIPFILTSEDGSTTRECLSPWLNKAAIKDVCAVSLENFSTLILAIDEYWSWATGRQRYTIAVSHHRLCPCGSGKEFKTCCGQRTLH